MLTHNGRSERTLIQTGTVDPCNVWEHKVLAHERRPVTYYRLHLPNPLAQNGDPWRPAENERGNELPKKFELGFRFRMYAKAQEDFSTVVPVSE